MPKVDDMRRSELTGSVNQSDLSPGVRSGGGSRVQLGLGSEPPTELDSARESVPGCERGRGRDREREQGTEFGSDRQPVTPAFVVDEATLRRQAASFTAAMARVWPNGIVAYSVKTNSLPWIVAWMRTQGIWAETVSDDEYDLARALGHKPTRMVFNGPVKSREALLEAVQAGSIVNLDSRREVRWVCEYAHAHPAATVKVGVRINWNLDAECPGSTLSGQQGLRFGFHIDNGDLDDAIGQLKAAGVTINGLHLHATSLTRSLDLYRSAARAALKAITRHALALDYIDMGGGFFGGESPDFPTPAQYIEEIRDALCPVIDPTITRLIIEPGSALVSVAVDCHTSVVDAKPVQDYRVVVTDGSRTYMDPFFGGPSFQCDLVTEGEPISTPQVICGFTCVDTDRLTVLTDCPKLQEGDRVIYRQRGHYTSTFDTQFINYLPRVYVQTEAGELIQVRRRGTTADYLTGNEWGAP